MYVNPVAMVGHIISNHLLLLFFIVLRFYTSNFLLYNDNDEQLFKNCFSKLYIKGSGLSNRCYFLPSFAGEGGGDFVLLRAWADDIR